MPMKLCAHSIFESGDAVRLCLEGGAPGIKVLNNSYRVDERVLALTPRPFVIGRHIVDNDPPNDAYLQLNPKDVARWYIGQMESDIRLNPHIGWWEGPNEPGDGGDDLETKTRYMAWYGAFEAERISILREEFNRGAVFGNFSTGTPYEPPEDPMRLWRAFWPAFQAARKYNAVLGLHEYAGPDRNLDGKLWLKYRNVLRWLRETGGGIRIAMTECGFDSTPGNPPGDAWRAMRLSPETYAGHLMWYDQQLQQDSEVICACLFTYGHSTGWPDFDLEGTTVTDWLIAYSKMLRKAEEIMPITILVGDKDPMEFAFALKSMTEYWNKKELENGQGTLAGWQYPIPWPPLSFWVHTKTDDVVVYEDDRRTPWISRPNGVVMLGYRMKVDAIDGGWFLVSPERKLWTRADLEKLQIE